MVWDGTPIAMEFPGALFERIGNLYSCVIDRVVCIIQNKQ